MTDINGTPGAKSYDLEILKKGDLTEILLNSDCGGFQWICCLSDPYVYEAARALARMSAERRNTLLRRICLCRVAAPGPTPQPVNGPPMLTTQPVPNPPAGPTPVQTGCPRELPPANTFTG